MRFLVICCLVLAFVVPARAQMVLPGAVAPTPAGAQVAPSAAAGHAARPRPRASPEASGPLAPARIAPATTLAGQTLYLNGRKSQVAFELRDKAIVASRLTLGGEQISNSRETCQVEVPGGPFATTDLGHPDGVARIRIVAPTCPIAFDVLDGAALATGDPATCEFKEANCRVPTAGLWGPQPAGLGPDKSKGIEHARAQAEAAVRANFKRLLLTTKDKPTIVGYAREQAGFSSAREEVCRDYAGEDKHGFCATRLTEARAAALRAKLETEEAGKPLRKKKHAG